MKTPRQLFIAAGVFALMALATYWVTEVRLLQERFDVQMVREAKLVAQLEAQAGVNAELRLKLETRPLPPARATQTLPASRLPASGPHSQRYPITIPSVPVRMAPVPEPHPGKDSPSRNYLEQVRDYERLMRRVNEPQRAGEWDRHHGLGG